MYVPNKLGLHYTIWKGLPGTNTLIGPFNKFILKLIVMNTTTLAIFTTLHFHCNL
jgi:hypothetical protein